MSDSLEWQTRSSSPRSFVRSQFEFRIYWTRAFNRSIRRLFFCETSVHYFLEWRPVMALAIVDHPSHIVGVSRKPSPTAVEDPVTLSGPFPLPLSRHLSSILESFGRECSTRSTNVSRNDHAEFRRY